MRRQAIRLLTIGIGVGLTTITVIQVRSQSTSTDDRQFRFRPVGTFEPEGPPAGLTAGRVAAPTEAPAGFDNRTNGFDIQGPTYESLVGNNVVPLRSFNDNRFIFEEVERVADGLGPTYNAQSCRECHQNVVTGGASQIAEHRTGHLFNGSFFESLGGSLVQSRATHPDIVERVNFEDDVRTFRISTNTLGGGYVEAISNTTLLAIRDGQPSNMRGTALDTPVLEARSQTRVGRFGWKCQHSSLQSFSADAYLNEMGITSPLFPTENTSSGKYVGFGSGYDTVRDVEDDGEDVMAFANFMRSTKAPSRGPITAAVQAGDGIFRQIGCATCHVASITTAAPGTVVNGGKFTIPDALGNKIIHPYSDFLLHNIGTGDGIPVIPDSDFAFTANLIRTAPLWALRTRNRLMHDGLSFTLQEAIARHAGQAAGVTSRYNTLSDGQKNSLLAFLNSL